MPKAGDGDPRNHRADACESVQDTSNYVANLGQDARRQCACDKGQFRTWPTCLFMIGKMLSMRRQR